MRDRLIELIRQCYEKFRKSDETYIEPYLADYLLESDIFKQYENEIDRLKAQIAVYEGWGK